MGPGHSTGRGIVGRGVRRARPRHRYQRSYRGLILLAVFAVAASADLTHVVVEGENLTRIARRYGNTPTAIAEANKISNPSLILIGQKLVIPGGSPPAAAAAGAPATPATHVVAQGENLTVIAKRYGTTPAVLAQMNEIRNPSLIRSGQKLNVPSPYSPGVEGLLERYADEFRVDRALIKALAWQESGWQQGVVSSAGAVGVMQVLPETAAFVSRSLLKAPANINQVEDNVKLGARFFAYLLSLTGGDEQLAIAGYFQGLRSVRTVGITPKTSHYLANVMALRKRFS